ncbi:MAG: hypothetical protein HKN03_03710 [Acidimicrobiales bacterium]|nr:hypothetical protein [Acidimicrobiales bacterium]
MTKPEPFPVRPGTLFKEGVQGYFGNIVPLTAAALVTLTVFYLIVALPASQLNDNSKWVRGFAFAGGLILTGTTAYPWYSYALDAGDGIRVRWKRPFEKPELFVQQAVSSFWFWAAVALGFQYLFATPAIFVVILYAFHGYLIADRRSTSGMKALGTSVRLGEGSRIILFGLFALFGFFSLLGAIPLGIQGDDGEPLINVFTVSLAVVGLALTTSVTLVAGGRIYRILLGRLIARDKAPR